MANASRVTLNSSTPTLLWSGVGNVVLALVSGAASRIGGPGVTAATGFDLPGGFKLPLNVNSPDEIWGITDSGSSVVSVLEVR